MTRTLLESALSYARRGWRVFPLHTVDVADSGEVWCSCGRPNCEDEGKHPRTEHGVKDATTDEAVITKWWTDWPIANIGLATGAKSGVVAVDVDPRHGGDATRAALEAEHEPLLPTVESRTGGGGQHFLFQHPGPGLLRNQQNQKKDEAPDGIDLKTDGGYIVLPPSLHKSGRRYEWSPGRSPEEVALAPIPEWLVGWLQARSRPTTREAPATAATTGDLILDGARNNTLTSLAGTMRRRGMTAEEITAALQVVNQRRVRTPLSEEEVARIAQSVSQYAPADHAPNDSPLVPAVRVWTWREIIDDPLPPPRMLVDQLFLSEHIAVIGGLSFSGKSAMALGLAVAVASGQKALRYFDVSRPAPVVYVFAEQGPELWQARFRKTARALGIDDHRDLPITLIEGYEYRLNQPQGLDDLLRQIDKARATSGFVILDPMAVLFSMEDENNPSEAIRSARRPLQRLIQTAGVTPSVVHHSAKNARHVEPFSPHDLIRGSGDFSAMSGSVIGVWRKGGTTDTKVLVEGRLDQPPAFRLRPIGRSNDSPSQVGPDPAFYARQPVDWESENLVVLEWDGWWSTSGSPTAKPEPATSRTLRAIRRLYGSKRTPIPWPAIKEATGLSKPTIFRHCNELVELKQLKKTRDGWVPTSEEPES